MDASSMISRSHARDGRCLFEPAGHRVHFEEPVNGLGFEASGFRHSLGGSAGRRAEQQLHTLGTKIRKMALTRVVLPTPGPPVMTRTFDRRANRMAAI